MPKSAPNFLYSSDPGLILGFHGCELGTRDKILNGKDMLRPSKKNYEWLGTGMYFWQNNYERALDFVSTKNGNRSKAAKPAVLGAVISLGNCLDLMDTAYLRLLHQSYEAIAIAADAMGKVLPMNKNIPFTNSPADKVLRYLDCSVIENLHQIFNLPVYLFPGHFPSFYWEPPKKIPFLLNKIIHRLFSAAETPGSPLTS